MKKLLMAIILLSLVGCDEVDTKQNLNEFYVYNPKIEDTHNFKLQYKKWYKQESIDEFSTRNVLVSKQRR